jgi:hypothetical protein
MLCLFLQEWIDVKIVIGKRMHVCDISFTPLSGFVLSVTFPLGGIKIA